MSRRGNRMMHWHGQGNFRIAGLFILAVLVTLVLILFYGEKNQGLRLSSEFTRNKWNSFESSVQFHPTVEYRNGTDLIWQIPDSPKAVLFIAHGCNGRAVNFWDRSPSCQKCVGLPEERLIVLNALSRKFAVLTISSAGNCWGMREERLLVRDIIRWWVGKNKLDELPIVALGASSGGYFVSALATDLRFRSIVLMIAEGLFNQMDVPKDYPPTLFVHMPKDNYRQRKIDEYLEVLRNRGIDVAEVQCMEFPLSPNTLADRIPGLDQTVSSKLFELLRKKGFIDEKGYMKSDGRRTRWKEALRESKDISLDKQWIHHVQEELNLAFAYHEMTSLPSEQIFKWFESH